MTPQMQAAYNLPHSLLANQVMRDAVLGLPVQYSDLLGLFGPAGGYVTLGPPASDFAAPRRLQSSSRPACSGATTERVRLAAGAAVELPEVRDLAPDSGSRAAVSAMRLPQ